MTSLRPFLSPKQPEFSLRPVLPEKVLPPPVSDPLIPHYYTPGSEGSKAKIKSFKQIVGLATGLECDV